MYNTVSMYIQYNTYMYKYIHTYEADVNLMCVHVCTYTYCINTGESSPLDCFKGLKKM